MGDALERLALLESDDRLPPQQEEREQQRAVEALERLRSWGPWERSSRPPASSPLLPDVVVFGQLEQEKTSPGAGYAPQDGVARSIAGHNRLLSL